MRNLASFPIAPRSCIAWTVCRAGTVSRRPRGWTALALEVTCEHLRVDRQRAVDQQLGAWDLRRAQRGPGRECHHSVHHFRPPSRRRDCHFADGLSPSQLKNLLNVEGSAAE